MVAPKTAEIPWKSMRNGDNAPVRDGLHFWVTGHARSPMTLAKSGRNDQRIQCIDVKRQLFTTIPNMGQSRHRPTTVEAGEAWRGEALELPQPLSALPERPLHQKSARRRPRSGHDRWTTHRWSAQPSTAGSFTYNLGTRQRCCRYPKPSMFDMANVTT
jgi:hypothetical protein